MSRLVFFHHSPPQKKSNDKPKFINHNGTFFLWWKKIWNLKFKYKMNENLNKINIYWQNWHVYRVKWAIKVLNFTDFFLFEFWNRSNFLVFLFDTNNNDDDNDDDRWMYECEMVSNEKCDNEWILCYKIWKNWKFFFSFRFVLLFLSLGKNVVNRNDWCNLEFGILYQKKKFLEWIAFPMIWKFFSVYN